MESRYEDIPLLTVNRSEDLGLFESLFILWETSLTMLFSQENI